MADGSIQIAEEARAKAYATPLEDFQVADAELFRTDTHWPWFERLRREDRCTTPRRANSAPTGR
jgi:hypothetical protein